MAWTYDENEDLYTVTFSELDDLLKSLPENTADTSYNVKVTELTQSEMKGGSTAVTGTLQYVLQQNPNKYLSLIQNQDCYTDDITDMSYCFGACNSLIGIKGLPNSVTNMRYCFFYCESFTEAPVIPNSVTNMEHCFYVCRSLTKAPVISNSVTNMGSCFDTCRSLTEAPVIPNSVTNMRFCFSSCYSLTKAPIIPNSVTNMEHCFQVCTSLVETPELPDSVIKMGGCFYYCTNLKRISQWDFSNLTSFDGAFENCSALEHILVHSAEQQTSLINFLTTNKASMKITFNISSVVKYAFAYQPNVEIPFSALNNSLSIWEENTLQTPYKITVTELTQTEMKGSSTAVAGTLQYTLQQNSNKYLSLIQNQDCYTDDITDIAGCFLNCSSLVEISALPDSITEMSSCFRGCSSLNKPPVIPGSVISLINCFYACQSLSKFPIIPNSVINMDGCFEQCLFIMDTPNIPNSVTSLNRAFYGCMYIEKVPDIPDSVISMPYCFYGCRSLTKAPIIPNSVTNMRYCFESCTSLTEVPIIPNSVTNMTGCFKDCKALKKISFFDYPSFSLSNSDAFTNCNALEYIGTTTTGQKQRIKTCIEKSITTLDLDSIIHYKDVIPYSELDEWLSTDNYSNTKDTPYTITVTELNQRAFDRGAVDSLRRILSNHTNIFLTLNENEDCYIEEITNAQNGMSGCSNLVGYKGLPSTLTNMEGFFSMCSALKEVSDIPQSVTNVKHCFEYCSSLEESPAIPDSITEMDYMFWNCTGLLVAPKLPASLVSLYYAFSNCSSLTEAPEIPIGVTDMDYCFQLCSSLTRVPNVPEYVKYLFYTFQRCTSLKSIDSFMVSAEDIESGVVETNRTFDSCENLESIYIPKQTFKDTESEAWSFVRITSNEDSVDYDIYNIKEGTVQKISSSLSPDTRTLEIIGDVEEFVESYDLSDEKIEKVLKYDVPFSSKKSNSLDPTESNFVLWAKDPTKIKSNFLDGIAGGSSITETIDKTLDYSSLTIDGNHAYFLDGSDIAFTLPRNSIKGACITVINGNDGTTNNRVIFNNPSDADKNIALIMDKNTAQKLYWNGIGYITSEYGAIWN